MTTPTADVLQPQRDDRATSLTIENVEAGYGETTVLRGVSMQIGAGEVIALLGANGAGKTTLLRAVSGLIPTRSGAIRIGHENLEGLSPDRRVLRGICHIPEGRGIFPSLSVRENLVVQSRRGDEMRVIEIACTMFPELANRMSQTAGSLSGGQQQMLALVRAYTADAKFVLVDEASMGLSPVLVDRIFDFLGEIVKAGSAVILVEQYVARALDLAERVYVLNRGNIVFSGTSSEIDSDEIFAQYLSGQ